MALTNSLPVYKAAYDLLLRTYQQRWNVPRDIRYTLLETMKQQQVGLLTAICRANATREKGEHIRAARDTLLEIRIRLRLLNDMKYLSRHDFALLSLQAEDVSKQLAAWEKSQKN